MTRQANEVDSYSQVFNSDTLITAQYFKFSKYPLDQEHYSYYPNGDFKSDVNWDYTNFFDNTYDADGDIIESMWEYSDFSATANYYTYYKYGELSSIPNSNNTGQEFKIFPDPARNQLVIDCNINNSDISITDITGKLLTVNANQYHLDHFEMDISSLKPGVYFISVSNGQGRSIQKFIKE